jgi:hypothetical protein
MVKWGRVTAALTLVAVGVMLVLDMAGVGDSWAWMRISWPLVLVSLGVELIVLQLVARARNLRMRVYWGGMLGTALAVGIAVLFLHGDRLQTAFPDLSRIGAWVMPDASGERFELETVRAALAPGVSTVTVRHEVGDVTIRQNDAAAEMVVNAVAYVDAEREKAEEIARNIRLEVRRTGGRLELVSDVPSYGRWWWWQKPRVDLTVTLPGGPLPVVAAELTSGSLDAAGLGAEVRLQTKNGDIRVADIDGGVAAQTLNGDVRATDIADGAELISTNGVVTGSRIGGTVRARTVNGDVSLDDVRAGARAETVNGDVAIRSATLAGDWAAKTTNGTVRLEIPEAADATVHAENRFGDISSDLPLQIERNKAKGEIGAGTHRITADANGDITLVRYRP